MRHYNTHKQAARQPTLSRRDTWHDKPAVQILEIYLSYYEEEHARSTPAVTSSFTHVVRVGCCHSEEGSQVPPPAPLWRALSRSWWWCPWPDPAERWTPQTWRNLQGLRAAPLYPTSPDWRERGKTKVKLNIIDRSCTNYLAGIL